MLWLKKMSSFLYCLGECVMVSCYTSIDLRFYVIIREGVLVTVGEQGKVLGTLVRVCVYKLKLRRCDGGRAEPAAPSPSHFCTLQ